MVGMHADVHSAASLSWPALQEYLTMAYETLQHAQQHDRHVEQTTRCHDAAQPPHTLRTRMQWYTCVYNACSGDPTRSRALYARLTATLVDLAEQCVLYPLLQRYERVCARHDDDNDTAANATTHTAQHIRLVTCDDDDDDDAGQDGGVLCDVGAHMVAGDGGSHRHSTHDTSHTQAHTGDVHSATAPLPSAAQHDEQHDVARRYDVLVSFVRSCVAFCLFRRTVVSCFCYLDQHYTRRCGVDTVTMLCAKLFYLVVYTPLRELLTRELLCLLHDTRDAYEAAAAAVTTDAHGNDGDDAAAAATRAQTCAQLLYDVLSNIHELLSAVKATPSYTLTDTTTTTATATTATTTRTTTATMAAVAAPGRHASPSLAHARCNSDDMDASHNNNNNRSSSSRSSGGGGDSKTVSRASRAQQTSLTASPDDAHALPARSCSYTHSGDSDGNSNSRTAAAAAASMTRRTRVRVDVRATAQLRARLRDDVVAPLLNIHAQRYIERCVRASTSSGAGRMTTSHGHAGTTTTTATTAVHLVSNSSNNNNNNNSSSTGHNELVASLVTDVRPSLTELVLCDYGNAYVAATTAYYRHACRVRLSSLQGRRGHWAWVCSVLLREHAMLCGARDNNSSSADEARTQQQQQQQQQKAPSSHTMLWQRVRDALLRVLLSDVHRRLLLDDACGLRVLLDAWYGNGDDDNATLLAAAVARAQVTAVTVTADTSTTSTTTSTTTTTATAMNSSSMHTRRTLAEVAMHNMYVMLAATHEEAAVLLMAALVASKVLHSAADALFVYVQQQQQAAQQLTTPTCTSHVSTDGASVLLATRLLRLSVHFSSLVQTHMAHDTLLTSAVGDALCEVVNSARWCSRAAVATTTTATAAVVSSLRDTNVFASLSSLSSLPSVLLSHDAGARAMAPLYAVARAAAAAAVTTQRTQQQQQQHGRRRGGNGSHDDDNNNNVNSSTSSSYALPLPLPSLGRTLLDWCDDYAMHAQPPPPRHRASSDDSNNSSSSKGTVRGAGDDQDDDVVVLLAHVARLVGYLDDASAFVDAYQQRLSRRLLSLLSLLLSSPPSSQSLRQRHRVCHLASADAAACDTLHEDENNSSSSNNNRSSSSRDDDIVMYVRERLRVERALVRELRSCMPLSNIVYRMHVMLRDVHTCAMHVDRHKTTTTATTTAITTAPARVTCTSLRVCMLTAAHWPASLVACASSLSPVFASATTTTAGTAAAASVHASLLLPHTLLQLSWQAAVARFVQHDVRTHGQRNVQWLHAYTTITLRYHRRRRQQQQHSDAVYGSIDTADAAAVATSSCDDVAVDIVANTTQAAVLLTLDDDDCVVRVDDDTSSHRRAVAATVAATVAHTTTATGSSSSSAADDKSTRDAVRTMTGEALARRLRIPFAQLRPHLCALVQSAPQTQPPRRPQHERPHVLCDDDGDGNGSSSSSSNDAVCTPLLVVVRNGAVVDVAGNVQRLCSHDAFALRSSTTTTTAGTGQHQQSPQQQERVTVVNVAYARLHDDGDAADDGGSGDGGGGADDVDAAATRCAARTYGDTALAHSNTNNNNNSQTIRDHATRVRQLEAVVMRLLKAHSDGTLAFDTLQQSCVTQLRTAHHTPTRADVKHALERLIDRGFVRRRADNNAIYEYIA